LETYKTRNGKGKKKEATNGPVRSEKEKKTVRDGMELLPRDGAAEVGEGGHPLSPGRIPKPRPGGEQRRGHPSLGPFLAIEGGSKNGSQNAWSLWLSG